MSIAQKIMEYKGFKAEIREAERLTGEYTHALPPGTPLDVYNSDVFVEYPEQWMRGPGVFVVPVRANRGLWFNWTMNSIANTAVVPTVKGCNPITGLQTSGTQMERYEEKCPKHGVEFQGDRYCSECGYKWPAQNYIASPNTLWLDGFRSEDGSVRQFFFTEDEIRDVATHMIGKENTVPAFGFAFYQPKEIRPESGIRYNYNYYHLVDTKPWYVYSNSSPYYTDSNLIYSTIGNSYLACKTKPRNKHTYSSSEIAYSCAGESNTAASVTSDSFLFKDSPRPIESEVKEVSVGAGAKIQQDLAADPYPLDTWRDKPSASMVIYFVFQEKLDQMLSKGIKNLTGKREGMLDGLPVG